VGSRELDADSARPSARWAIFAVFAGCFAISLAREPGALLHPVLEVEDASHLFGFYYLQRDPSTLLRFYFGRISLVPNLVGYLAFFLPTAVVPYVFALFPLLISSATFACFSATRFRSLVSSDVARASICLVLVAAPMGNALLIGNTMFSMWSLLLLLALLSLPPLSGGRAALVLRGAAMSLMACSHPASVVLLPLWIASAIRERSRQALVFYAVLVTVTLGYLSWGVRPGALAMPDLFEALGATALLVVERVAGVALAGVQWAKLASRSGLGTGLLWSSSILPILLLVGVASAPRKPTRDQVFQLLALVYLIVAFTATVWFAREAGRDEIGRRLQYFWIQRELFILLVLSSAFLCAQLRDRLFSPKRLALISLLLAGWLGHLNYWDSWRYEVRRTAGYQVEKFIADIVAQEKRLGDRSQVRSRLDRGVFSITFGGKGPPRG